MRTISLAPLLMLVAALAGGCDRSTDRSAPAPAPSQAPAAVPAIPAAVPAALPNTAATAPAAAAAVADPAAPPAEVLAITPRAPAPGTTWIEKFDATLDFDLDFGGHEQITRTKQSKAQRVTALATEHDQLTRARITYTKQVTSMIIDDDPRSDPSPIRGKTYVIEWKGGVLDVRRPSGRAPTAAEIEQVRKERTSFQRLEALGRALAHVRLPKDQPIELPLVGFDAIDKELLPERVVATYRGMERDLARIDVEIDFVDDDEEMRLYADVTGTAWLDLTGWCVAAEIDAQIRAELGDTVVGSGVAHGKISAGPRR